MKLVKTELCIFFQSLTIMDNMVFMILSEAEAIYGYSLHTSQVLYTLIAWIV
jgi:hypothetical protein